MTHAYSESYLNNAKDRLSSFFDLGGSRGRDLISGEERELHGELYLPPMSCAYWEILG